METQQGSIELSSSSYRWIILIVYSLLIYVNTLYFFTFAEIFNYAEIYFSGMSKSSITSFSVIYSVLYAPGSVFAMFTMKKYGLRYTIVLGSAFTALAGGCQLCGALIKSSIGVEKTYAMYCIGQVFAGLAQPMLCNVTPAVANAWFPVSERDIVVKITMFLNMCSATGAIIPLIFVGENDDDDVYGFQNLALFLALTSTFSFILALLTIQSKPHTPPSHSEHLRNSVRINNHYFSY